MMLALLSLLALTSAVPTCDECISAMDGLVTRLTSDASIEEQVGILLAAVCPQDPEGQEHCEAELPLSWPEIARLLYPFYLDSQVICAGLGSCVREWTCEECTAGMETIAAMMEDPTLIAAAVQMLQGEAYCGTFHPDHAECPEDVAFLVPASVPVLAAVLRETSTEICQDNVGVC